MIPWSPKSFNISAMTRRSVAVSFAVKSSGGIIFVPSPILWSCRDAATIVCWCSDRLTRIWSKARETVYTQSKRV